MLSNCFKIPTTALAPLATVKFVAFLINELRKSVNDPAKCGSSHLWDRDPKREDEEIGASESSNDRQEEADGASLSLLHAPELEHRAGKRPALKQTK
ncbi:uncharacterized protein A4U43_C05F17390 [Asparagus officinalis]|uniref:Uncharacterized protein n=1 Tax=Asparagus officinalis TaxID=4686 RepID=A0A5P1ES91_ASPOF|nr:uncharacterized protein A4U43_C05F17390 [Asparagus officinalis]